MPFRIWVDAQLLDEAWINTGDPSCLHSYGRRTSKSSAKPEWNRTLELHARRRATPMRLGPRRSASRRRIFREMMRIGEWPASHVQGGGQTARIERLAPPSHSLLSYVLGTVGKSVLVKEFDKTIQAIEAGNAAAAPANSRAQTPTTAS
jgi:hypothetical protein